MFGQTGLYIVKMVTLWLLIASVIFTVTDATGIEEDNERSTNISQAESHLANNQTYKEDVVFPYFEPEVSNATLRKCFCKSGQAWNGSSCQETGTVVVVIDQNTYETVLVNTSFFGDVNIGEVFCPEGTKYELSTTSVNNSNPTIFYIKESGKIDWNDNIFDNYCIENVYGSDDISNELIAQICIEPLWVPACCQEGYSLDASGVCVVSPSSQTSPPVDVTENQSLWQTLKFRGVDNISCGEVEKMYIKNIDNKHLYPIQDTNKPFLEWKSPHTFKYHRIDDYCVSSLADNSKPFTYVAKFCHLDVAKDHEEKCTDRTCVRKCCGTNEHFVNHTCSYDASFSFNPVFHYPTNLTPGAREPEDLTVVNGMPLCPLFYPLEKEDDIYYLLQDGKLYSPGLPEPFPPTKYCVETFLEDYQFRTFPIVCFPPKESLFCKSLQTYLYPILLLISAGFLAITLLVYISVPELHAKVHGKCLISHVTALLVAYLSLFTVQRLNSIREPFCKFMASVTHISFLAAFFWLNVMCFDIWWTLKSMHPVPETGEQSRLRFKLYSLYSWGCPLIIAIVSLVIQSLPEEFDVIRLGFGESRCWFADYKSQWLYFYGFVLVLVVINIIFFVHVAVILIVAHSDSVLQRTRQKNRERMWLYVKLFVVMGVTWLAEAISWRETVCEVWIVTDIINSLQGLLIFLIFTCKRNLLKKMISKCETFLRHLKDSVRSGKPNGTKNPASGTGRVVSEQLSHSLSELRSNHSATSHRTLQSQLSCESDSALRRASTGSEASTIAGQVLAQDNIQMDPNAKASNSKPDHCPSSKDSVVVSINEETEKRSNMKTDHEEEDDNMIVGDTESTVKTSDLEKVAEV